MDTYPAYPANTSLRIDNKIISFSEYGYVIRLYPASLSINEIIMSAVMSAANVARLNPHNLVEILTSVPNIAELGSLICRLNQKDTHINIMVSYNQRIETKKESHVQAALPYKLDGSSDEVELAMGIWHLICASNPGFSRLAASNNINEMFDPKSNYVFELVPNTNSSKRSTQFRIVLSAKDLALYKAQAASSVLNWLLYLPVDYLPISAGHDSHFTLVLDGTDKNCELTIIIKRLYRIEQILVVDIIDGSKIYELTIQDPSNTTTVEQIYHTLKE
ncbi:MAG: hypothetical protein KatS3mg085_597 [Candidatus Dojkabacteria bacterium]|nr:MAG: hypothetical protein KatS3mg085_597 [Candidatus Dojkabacteria bacterium]